MEKNGPLDWHKEETYKSMLAYAQICIKAVFLLNGAALIALMTFIGNLITKQGLSPDKQIKHGMILFVIGIIFAGLSTFFGYKTQFNLFNDLKKINEKNTHMHWFWITASTISISLISFSTGSFFIINGL